MKMCNKQGKIVVGVLTICGILIYQLFSHKQQELLDYKREKEKFKDYFQLLSHWLEVKSDGRSTVEYFKERGYDRIAIYGMGELANRLWEELDGTKIDIVYGIDQDVCNTISRMDKIYSPDDVLEKVDAVIVTPFYAMDQIKNRLMAKVEFPIISLEEVVWSL